MESFKSWGYKISDTKKCNPAQKCTVLFLSVSTTDVGHSAMLIDSLRVEVNWSETVSWSNTRRSLLLIFHTLQDKYVCWKILHCGWTVFIWRKSLWKKAPPIIRYNWSFLNKDWACWNVLFSSPNPGTNSGTENSQFCRITVFDEWNKVFYICLMYKTCSN